VNGASWVQEEVLTKHKDAPLEVYAIWFSMYPTDRRELWPADILTDPRVSHFWDEGKLVGTFYANRFHEMEGLVTSGSTDLGAPILWDAYLVYGPDARWDDAPSGLRRWGRTILKTQDGLRQSVDDLLSASSR
jgi:hypothetical protein